MKRITNAARLTSLALLAMVLVVLVPGEANACSCAPVTTEEMVAGGDVVFVGEEISRSPVPQGQDFAMSQAVTFNVVEAYKGDVTTEMVLMTGSGGGDCGVGPQPGLIGIVAYGNGDRLSYNICGSLHEPGAIAALLDPIDLAGQPAAEPLPEPGGGTSPMVWVGAAAAGALLIGLGVARNRRQDWHDGWSSDGSTD